MNLKFTKYFLNVEDTDGNLLLLNTYNGCFVKVNSQQKEQVLKLIGNQKASEIIKPTLIEKLEKASFLLKDEVDEEKRVENKYVEICSSNRSLELIIMPTEECNFRCIYCYENFSKGRMEESTQKDIIKYVKRELKHYESLNVEWFGGEPLLALDIIENLSHEFKTICKAQKKAYSAGMTTNGFLLTVDVFKRLFKYNVTRYQITLDGPREIHNQQRKLINSAGTYDVILKNLTDIRDNISSKLFIISIRSNLMKAMDSTKINAYCMFLEKEFGKDHRFVYDDFNMAWNPNERKSLENKIYDKNEFTNVIKKNNIKQSKFLYGIINGGIICYASKRSSIVIGSDGNLYKCNVAFEKEINKIGKLLTGGYMQIDYDKLLYWTTRSESDRKHCSKCPLLPSCYGLRCPNKKNMQDCDEVINDIKYAMKLSHDIAFTID